MSKNFWQRKAPLLMLTIVVAVMATAVWWHADRRSASNTGSAATAPAPPDSGPEEVGLTAGLGQSVLQPRVESGHSDNHRGHVSDQGLQAELISELGELDRKFQSEPVSATWSGNTQQMIAAALSDGNLAAKEAPRPIAHEAECRTFSCRIRVTYRNEMDAQMGEIFLLGDIAKELPSAQFGRLGGRDGTIQIVMYANTGRAKGRN